MNQASGSYCRCHRQYHSELLTRRGQSTSLEIPGNACSHPTQHLCSCPYQPTTGNHFANRAPQPSQSGTGATPHQQIARVCPGRRV
jgi:hypothetical protein